MLGEGGGGWGRDVLGRGRWYDGGAEGGGGRGGLLVSLRKGEGEGKGKGKGKGKEIINRDGVGWGAVLVQAV